MSELAPLVDVEDYSLYFFILFVIVVMLFIAITIFIFKNILVNRAKNRKKELYQKLVDIDMVDTKKAAYEMSYYGRFFIDDNPRVKRLYEILFDRLDIYKYAKSVEAFDGETMGYYHLFIEAIDV